MQNQNPFFEDLSRLMSSVAGTMAGASREAETRMREKLREVMGGMDMVSREEFEAVKALASETRAELEALKAELHGKGKPAAAPSEDAAKPRAKPRKIDIS